MNGPGIRLKLESIQQDPLHWTVFGRPLDASRTEFAGYRLLGTVSRDPRDATPFGEQLLWTRLRSLLERPGPSR